LLTATRKDVDASSRPSPFEAAASTHMRPARNSGYARVNGLNLYPAIIAGRAHVDPGVAEALKHTPFYELYVSIAPRPADWPVLVAKMGELARQHYDWSKEVAAIAAPTLLVFGDADAVRPAHAVEFFELLGGGKEDGGWDGSGISSAQLAILPGVTHYNVVASPALPEAVTSFLDARRQNAERSL